MSLINPLFRVPVLILAAALAFAPVAAQTAPEPAQGSARLWPGMGEVNHPISTKNAEAQKYFNQGLAFVYGFNHEEAVRSFQRAAELDPKMAMAYWGVALAVGPNYNLPIDEEREKQAYAAIQKAIHLSAAGPAIERDYIQALARRYTNQSGADYKKLDADYNAAMRELSRGYPDDLDAATLYAESGMNLRPWKLWEPDGTPAPGTLEIVRTLESVLKRDPNHLGANHYYIHALEASRHPEWAQASAQRLANLAPSAGHLVHMPAHIHIRTGDHAAAEHTNQLAASADEQYLKASGAQGTYPMMYYTHNLHFIATSNAMMGNYNGAVEGARRIEAYVKPHLQHMPMLDNFNSMPTLVLVRFRKWDDILRLPKPDSALPLSTGIWHYARGLAFAARGEIAEASAELQALRALELQIAKVPTGAPGPGNAEQIPRIAAHLIEARIATAQRNNAAAVDHLREAVALEDQMDYTEPPDWFYPTRETLGGVLLMNGNAVGAEKVFRDDLERNPRNGRSLFGLMESLKAQGKNESAAFIQQQFENAWKHADTKLNVSDL